jgi:hypothetical protein
MVYCARVVGALGMSPGIGIAECSKRTGNHEEAKELSSDGELCGSNTALAALRDRDRAVN